METILGNAPEAEAGGGCGGRYEALEAEAEAVGKLTASASLLTPS